MTEVPQRARPPVQERTETSSVSGLRDRFGRRNAVPAGEVVGAVLEGHVADYVDKSFASRLREVAARLASQGPARTIAEHLDVVAARWDAARVPLRTGRHVVLALSLDAGVGDVAIRDGVIGSMLRTWRPGLGTAEEPHRLVWDVLSAAGRNLAEGTPVLATAFGAPAEVSAEIPGTEPLRAMAWSPSGDRLAVLEGDTVHVVRPGPDEEGSAYPLGTIGPGAASVAWGGRGVIGLILRDDLRDVVRVADGTSLGDLGDAVAGTLSGNGGSAWVLTPAGIQRLAPGVNDPPQAVHPPTNSAGVAAVDHAGRYALLRLPTGDALVSEPAAGSAVPDPPPSGAGPSPVEQTAQTAQTAPSTPSWPPDAAPLVWQGPATGFVAAIVSVGDEPAVAYATPDGVEVDRPPFAAGLCRIASGPDEVTAMAVDPTGTRLAVAAGRTVRVWSLAASRATSTPVPAYDSDRSSGTRDLLTADRDADAIAALVSASDLRPPLSIGLFGAWGSGKSFILNQVTARLEAGGRGAGYLQHIRVVSFNAWHYAEADLWASLVDQVLRVIAPRKPESPPEVTAAAEAATTARTAAARAADDVEAAEKELLKAREALVRRRRRAAYLGAFVLILAAVAIVAVITRGVDRNIAAIAAAAALLSSAAGILARARTAGEQARDLADAGRSGIAVVGRLIGRPEELAVRTRAEELRRMEVAKARADAEAERLETARTTVQDIADDQPLGVLLNRLSTISEYRDKLSLVTRTRSYFSTVDSEVRAARNARTAAPAGAEAAHGPELERIVIIIDDLDRCPPEKVVTVLEAVHLLFDFELFVVLIAVDTRWLEQSLQIHYRRLLGRPRTARPTDYLEKIIQIPLHLLPLDESMVRAVIAGLTGTRRRAPGTPAGVAVTAGPIPDPAGRPATASGPLTATTPRARRGPLPAEVMRISAREADAMSTVASLVGTTPRTAKRFVNTYRLLKARAADPSRFDRPGPVTGANRRRPGSGPGTALGDHEVVAFLLAVVTGRPQVAQAVLRALLDAPPRTTAQQALSSVVAPAPPWPAATPPAGTTPVDELDSVRAWLTMHIRYGLAPAQRYAPWVPEVSRFSFTPLG